MLTRLACCCQRSSSVGAAAHAGDSAVSRIRRYSNLLVMCYPDLARMHHCDELPFELAARCDASWCRLVAGDSLLRPDLRSDAHEVSAHDGSNARFLVSLRAQLLGHLRQNARSQVVLLD